MPVSSLALGPAPLTGSGEEPAQPPAPGDAALTQPSSDQLSPEARQQDPPPPQRIPRWLVRVELFLRVMLRMYIGLFICYAPWWRAFWDQNPIFLQFPSLGIVAANGA